MFSKDFFKEKNENGNRLFTFKSTLEDGNGEVYMQVVADNIKTIKQLDEDEIAKIENDCDADKTARVPVTYYAGQNEIGFKLPGRLRRDILGSTQSMNSHSPFKNSKNSFKLPYPETSSVISEIKKDKHLYAIKAINKGNDNLQFNLYKISNDKSSGGLTLPLLYTSGADYDLDKYKAEACVIASSIKIMESGPVIIDKSKLPEGLIQPGLFEKRKMELFGTGAPPKTKIIGSKEISPDNHTTVRVKRPYSTYMTDAKGDLFAYNASTKIYDGTPVVSYDLLQLELPEEAIIQSVKKKFNDQDRLMAMGELVSLLMSGGSMKMEEEKFYPLLSRAGFEDAKMETLWKTYRQLGKLIESNYSKKEIETIQEIYIINQEHLVKAVAIAKEALQYEDDPEKYRKEIAPALDLLNIESKENPYTINNRIKKHIRDNYGRNALKYLDWPSSNSTMPTVSDNTKKEEKAAEKILTYTVEANTGYPFQSIKKDQKYGADNTFKVNYNSSSIDLSLKTKRDTTRTTWNMPLIYWDSRQLFTTLPYLDINDDFSQKLNLVDFDDKRSSSVTSTIKMVMLKTIGEEKITVAGEKKKVYVVEMQISNELFNPYVLDDMKYYKFKDDGTPYVTLYMDRSFPHQLYKVELKDDQALYFIDKEEMDLNEWYSWTLSD